MIPSPQTYTVICCATCGHLLGTSDGRRLILGMAVVRRSTLLICLVCGGKHLWRPAGADRIIDKMADLCNLDA